MSAALALTLALAACGSDSNGSANGAAGEPPPPIECAETSAQQAVEQVLDQLPAPAGGGAAPGEPGSWNTDIDAATSGYDECAPLSWVELGINGATGSSPKIILLFHQGEFVATATTNAVGFINSIKRLDDDEIRVNYGYLQSGEGTANASGEALSRYKWDPHQESIVHRGQLPEGVETDAGEYQYYLEDYLDPTTGKISISKLDADLEAASLACEAILGSLEEFAAEFGISPERVRDFDAEGWDGDANFIAWNPDDPGRVVTSFACSLQYVSDGVDPADGDYDNLASIDILIGRLGPEAAHMSGDEFIRNGEDGRHVQAWAESDDVLAAASYGVPADADADAKEATFEEFLASKVLPQVQP